MNRSHAERRPRSCRELEGADRQASERRPSSVIAIAAATFILFVSLSTHAQIQARQGEKEEVFESPMILDVPIDLHTESFLKEGKHVTLAVALWKYVCENVSFVSIVAERDRVTDGLLPIKLTFTLRNKPGHDKLVNLRVQLMRDGKPISNAIRIGKIDVEEGRVATRRTILHVKEESLTAAGEPPVLTIKLDAVDH
jgi:hypothetical protein